ncbi:hypothetical protein ACHAXT_000748 [Thalassiosira profunda]
MTASKGKYTISERIASLQGQGFSGNEAEDSQVASGYWVTRAAAPKAEDQQRQQVKGKQLRTGWEAQRLDSEMERLKRELAEMQRIKSGGKAASLPPATDEVSPVSSEPASKSTASPSSLSSSESASKDNGVKESKKDTATGGEAKEGMKQKDEKPPAEDEVADATAKEQTTEEKAAESKKHDEANSAAPSGEKQEADKSKPAQKKWFKWNIRVGLAPRRRSSRNKAA